MWAISESPKTHRQLWHDGRCHRLLIDCACPKEENASGNLHVPPSPQACFVSLSFRLREHVCVAPWGLFGRSSARPMEPKPVWCNFREWRKTDWQKQRILLRKTSCSQKLRVVMKCTLSKKASNPKIKANLDKRTLNEKSPRNFHFPVCFCKTLATTNSYQIATKCCVPWGFLCDIRSFSLCYFTTQNLLTRSCCVAALCRRNLHEHKRLNGRPEVSAEGWWWEWIRSGWQVHLAQSEKSLWWKLK